ncbi:MAG TPA: preprotein translocase subunit SecG [Candidatus Binatia bacterium]|jgi:preprotein translocase subunit SecG|nr:preprotein translocase subunit SecG [Candidatus Binatia bacterium]
MWYTLLIVIHVLSCIFLVTVVLLQQGKGADIGAVFGGSSQTLFGSSGAGNFLTKLTSATAIIFMLTSLTLTYGAAKQTSRSIFDSAPKSAPAPATSEETPAAQPSASTENKETAVAPTGEPAQAAPAAAPSASEPAQSAPAATAPALPSTSQSSPTASQEPATK